jgi:hypothetical protein
MANSVKYGPRILDAGNRGDWVTFDVGQFTSARVQVEPDGRSAAWTTASLSVQGSIDGSNWGSLDTSLTLTTAGTTPTIDVSTFALLRVRVTAQESSVKLWVSCTAKAGEGA